MNGETITAIATAPGRGGVAIVRVSGPDAFALLKRLTGKDVSPGRVRFVDLGVDQCVVLAFKSPHSYTGEDVVEFQCHGGIVTPRRVLEKVLEAGARLARRGEFTERAYLNGKLDYEQAESVLNLIDAKTARAADWALQGLEGKRQNARRKLYETALSISTELEHALDIDEGELPADFASQMNARLAELTKAVAESVKSAREGKILREGALVVLAGEPNAGKSSLMNALLGLNRAIVSSTPGTTRDFLEEGLDLDGWPVRLVDTAGLRGTSNAIEAEGVKRAEDLIQQADIVLELSPTSTWRLTDAKVVHVHTKCDEAKGEGLNVSVKTGEGLDALKQAILARIEALEPKGDADHAEELNEILGLLKRTPPCGEDLVLAANLARTAAEKLGALIGATYSEDLLDRLFSRFCVGK